MQLNNLSAISPINIKWSNKYSEVLYKAAMLRAAKLNFPKKLEITNTTRFVLQQPYERSWNFKGDIYFIEITGL